MLSRCQGGKQEKHSKPSLDMRVCSADMRDGQVWLDRLPVELLVRIAKFVQVQKQDKLDLLCLGEATPTQRDAVVSVLCHIYPIDCFEFCYCPRLDSALKALARRWADLFKDVIRCLNIDGSYCLRDIRKFGVFAPMLTSPSLEAATIFGNASFSSALSYATGLRELEVYVLHDSKQDLLDLLESTTASQVSLICTYGSHSNCSLGSIRRELPRLSGRFQRVKLSFVCHISPSPLWDLLGRMRTLTAIESSQSPPEDACYLLRNLESVKLRLSDTGNGTVQRLGPALTGLTSRRGDGEPLHPYHLVPCSRLKELSWEIVEGEDWRNGFKDCAPGLRSLNELKISYVATDFNAYSIYDGSILHDYFPVCSSTPGFIRNLVEETFELSSFSLEYVTIALPELLGILKHCGYHLKSFTTCIEDQIEPELIRLGAVLDGIEKYNQNLEDFWADVFAVSPIGFPSRCTSVATDPSFLMKEGERLRSQMMRLQRTVPFLDISALRNFSDDLVRLGWMSRS